MAACQAGVLLVTAPPAHVLWGDSSWFRAVAFSCIKQSRASSQMLSPWPALLLSPGVPLHRQCWHPQLPPPSELPPPKTPAFCKALSIPSGKSGILIKSVSRP